VPLFGGDELLVGSPSTNIDEVEPPPAALSASFEDSDPMAPVQLANSLLPAAVAKAALTRVQASFTADYHDTLLLLVDVRSGGELAATLASHSPGAAGEVLMPRRQLEYQTAAHDPDRPESDLRATSAALGLGPRFVVPLRKRAGADDVYAERISVGRALNKDIVLRDASVSKFHAWFSLHEGREFTVADAGSRNLTRVNGEPIPSKRSWPIAPGDSVQFGKIETLLCSPESLWKAIHEARG
jgi:hypothetical protein